MPLILQTSLHPVHVSTRSSSSTSRSCKYKELPPGKHRKCPNHIIENTSHGKSFRFQGGIRKPKNRATPSSAGYFIVTETQKQPDDAWAAHNKQDNNSQSGVIKWGLMEQRCNIVLFVFVSCRFVETTLALTEIYNNGKWRVNVEAFKE